MDELEDAIDSGISIILLGDLNEGANDSEKTNEKFHNIGLFNVLQRRLGSYELPLTHILGSKTIDHIWATIDVFEAVTAAGFAPFQHVLENTDHRGLFMDVNLVEILDCKIVILKPASRRRLQATVPACVKKYLEHVQKCWKSQNVEARTKQIIERVIEHGISPELEGTLNNLDNNISEIMKHAEKNALNSIAQFNMIGA